MSFRPIHEKSSYIIEEAHFESLTSLMQIENIFNLTENCEIFTDNPRREFRKFKKHFHFLKAAGGIVKFDDKYLFIKRMDKWDLPKGKIEYREKSKNAAIREIHEECLLEGHYIESKICNTYHTYSLNENNILKKSSWYYLKVKEVNFELLKPQLEEGITEIRWFTLEEFDQVMENTFESIKFVLDEFLKIQQFESK